MRSCTLQPRRTVAQADDTGRKKVSRNVRMRSPSTETANLPMMGERIASDNPAAGPGLERTRRRVPAGAERTAPLAVAQVLGGGGGRPLNGQTRAYFEMQFGRDLSGVRVHTDQASSSSARAVQALAYTVGRDVVFREGAFAPESPAGSRLLAHELTHVIQQGAADSADAGTPQRSADGLVVSDPSDPAEREADAVADAVASGQSAPPPRILAPLLASSQRPAVVAPSLLAQQEDSQANGTDADLYSGGYLTSASPAFLGDAIAERPHRLSDTDRTSRPPHQHARHIPLHRAIALPEHPLISIPITQKARIVAKLHEFILESEDQSDEEMGRRVAKYLVEIELLDNQRIGELFGALQNEEAPLLKAALFAGSTFHALRDLGIVDLTTSIAWYVGTTIRDTVAGDFVDDPTALSIVLRTLLTLIPYVDQAADIEDVSANIIYALLDPKEKVKSPGWWFTMVCALVGMFPELGSAAVGVVKLGKKGVGHLAKQFLAAIPDVSSILASMGKLKSSADDLAELARSGVTELLEKADAWIPVVARQFHELISTLIDNLTALPADLSKKVAGVLESLRMMKEAADDMIETAIDDLLEGLRSLLGELELPRQLTPGDAGVTAGAGQIVPTNASAMAGRGRGGVGERGAARAAKAIDLPAWRKLTVDITHIRERHRPGGAFIEGRDIFPDMMNDNAVLSAIREAYESSTKVTVQGDRVLLRGQGKGFTIDIWLNKLTNTIETAYPVVLSGK